MSSEIEGRASPQVSSLLSHPHHLYPHRHFPCPCNLCSSLFPSLTCLKGHTFGPRLPFTLTATTNVWFAVSGGKWAEQIHQAFPWLFGRDGVIPAALFISPLSLTVSLLTLRADWWHCTLPHVPSPWTAETAVSLHYWRTLASRETHLQSKRGWKISSLLLNSTQSVALVGP